MENNSELISSDSARRKVNGYLGMYVSMALIGREPSLITREQEQYWRVPLLVQWIGLTETLILGQIDVNARTRDIVPLGERKIRELQDELDDIIVRLDSAKI